VGLQFPPPEVSGDIDPHHAPPFWPGHHPTHLLVAAMFAATVATTAARYASSSRVMLNVNPRVASVSLISFSDFCPTFGETTGSSGDFWTSFWHLPVR